MKKSSYRAGTLTGLSLYICGAALFWPVAEAMNCILFLIELLIIATGPGCPKTAVNPFVTVLGSKSDGHLRLNLARAFSPLDVTIAMVFGQSFILSNVLYQSQNVPNEVMPGQFSA